MMPISHTYVCLLMNSVFVIACVNPFNSRLCLHEGHAGGLVVVGVDGRHHLATDGVKDGQGGERPGDLAVLRHAPQLLGGLLDGAVVHQLDAAEGRGSGAVICSRIFICLMPFATFKLQKDSQKCLNMSVSSVCCGESCTRFTHA